MPSAGGGERLPIEIIRLTFGDGGFDRRRSWLINRNGYIASAGLVALRNCNAVGRCFGWCNGDGWGGFAGGP
jgi:hypothetical protein